MTVPHTHPVVVAMISGLLTCMPTVSWADAPTFDPEQPFRQAFHSSALRAVIDHALDFIEDHMEIDGYLADDQGDHRGRFQFKFYPKGKSQSNSHLSAEGWFKLSPGLGRQDFHFRFQQPDASSRLPLSSADDVW